MAQRWFRSVAAGSLIASILVLAGSMSQAEGSSMTLFEEVEGLSSLEQGVSEAGASLWVTPLVVGDGRLDILYAGTPDCTHCQSFVTGAFEDQFQSAFPGRSLSYLAEAARGRGLDLAYMPLALTPVGAVMAAAESCVAALPSPNEPKTKASGGEKDSDPILRLGQVYAVPRQLLAEADPGLGPLAAGETTADASATMTRIRDLMGVDPEGGEECQRQALPAFRTALEGFMERFAPEGTPAFFFLAQDGTVRRFAGAGGIDPMLKAMDQ